MDMTEINRLHGEIDSKIKIIQELESKILGLQIAMGDHQAANLRLEAKVEELSLYDSRAGKAYPRKPPVTRAGITVHSQVGTIDFYVIVNLYPDNTPCEVFVTVAKQGSTLRGLIDAWAATVSAALQNGVEWSELRERYRGHMFDPQDENHTSIVDAMATAIDKALNYGADQTT